MLVVSRKLFRHCYGPSHASSSSFSSSVSRPFRRGPGREEGEEEEGCCSFTCIFYPSFPLSPSLSLRWPVHGGGGGGASTVRKDGRGVRGEEKGPSLSTSSTEASSDFSSVEVVWNLLCLLPCSTTMCLCLQVPKTTGV